MTYSKTVILPDLSDLPFESISEMDEERWETRRIDFYRDGSVRLLGPRAGSHGDELSENPLPPDQLAELSPSIRILPASAEEFDRLWSSALISTAA